MKLLKPIISPKIYFPGLISLVLLPLLFVCFLFGKGQLTQLYQMRVCYYNKGLIDYWAKAQHKPPVYPDAFRHYKKVILAGNEQQNDLFLKDVSDQVKRIQVSADTVNGYQIQFSDKARYADVVKALDLFEKEQCNYIIYNGDVYLFWVKPLAATVMRSIDNMGLLFDDILIVKPRPTFLEKFERYLTIVRPFWPCLIPLFGMVFFWSRRARLHDGMPKQVRHDIS